MKLLNDWLWRAYAYVYNSMCRTFPPYTQLKEQILSYLPPVFQAQVLDIGCGSGEYTLALSKQGYQITAIDCDPHMLDSTRTKLAKHNLKAQLIQHDVTESRLPLEAHTFAISLAIHSFYMLRDPQTLLKEAARLLQEDGLLVAVTPRASLFTRSVLKTLFHDYGFWGGCVLLTRMSPIVIINMMIELMNTVGYFHCWDEDIFAQNLQEAGFEIISLTRCYLADTSLLALARPKSTNDMGKVLHAVNH